MYEFNKIFDRITTGVKIPENVKPILNKFNTILKVVVADLCELDKGHIFYYCALIGDKDKAIYALQGVSNKDHSMREFSLLKTFLELCNLCLNTEMVTQNYKFISEFLIIFKEFHQVYELYSKTKLTPLKYSIPCYNVLLDLAISVKQ